VGLDNVMDFEFQSQTGESYGLGVLGNLDEQLERMSNFDHDDSVLNETTLCSNLEYVFGHIKICEFSDFDDIMANINFDAAVGFGAKQQGILSRRDEDLYDYIAEYISLCQQCPHQSIITASQKDELRPEDIDTGKIKTPRLFFSCPVEQTFVARFVLGDFVRQFYSSSFCKDGFVSGVGDPTQRGAMAYVKDKMMSYSYQYCTDTKAQDSSVPASYINAFYDKLATKYNLDSAQKNLFETCRLNSIYKLVSVAGYLYEIPGGLASGDFLTMVINISFRHYLLLDSYCIGKSDFSKLCIEKFYQEVCPIIVGDDCIFASNDATINVKHHIAQVKGGLVPIEKLDFCSVSFYPYIHHSPDKVRAVLKMRHKKAHSQLPNLHMKILGGILSVLSNEEVYNET
jgi:hypothetical protein